MADFSDRATAPDANPVTRRTVIMGASVVVAAPSKVSAMVANGGNRAAWDTAMARYLDAKVETERHWREKYGPAHASYLQWVDIEGGAIGSGDGPDFWRRRAEVVGRYPQMDAFDTMAREQDRLNEIETLRKWELMATPAPDRAALLWKLDQAFEPDDDSDSDVPGYSKTDLRQTFAEYRRFLGDA